MAQSTLKGTCLVYFFRPWLKKHNPYFQGQRKKISLLLLETIKGLLNESVSSTKLKIFNLVCCLQSLECTADVVTDAIQLMGRLQQSEFGTKSIASSELRVHYVRVVKGASN